MHERVGRAASDSSSRLLLDTSPWTICCGRRQEIIEQNSPLKQFALPIVCDIAKASRRARAELKQHNGVVFYLGLLSTSYWQESALDALLVWLNDEPAHVERLMKTPQGIAQLSVVMESKNNAAFVNMLDYLAQIVYKSSTVNRALGKIDVSLGHSPFVQMLVSRLSHPNALVRRLLLNVRILVQCGAHECPQTRLALSPSPAVGIGTNVDLREAPAAQATCQAA